MYKPTGGTDVPSENDPNQDFVPRGDAPPEHHSKRLPKISLDKWKLMTVEQRAKWLEFVDFYKEELLNEYRQGRYGRTR